MAILLNTGFYAVDEMHDDELMRNVLAHWHVAIDAGLLTGFLMLLNSKKLKSLCLHGYR